MKYITLLLIIFLSQFTTAQDADLTGEWTIDLRPTPDAEAYYQPFEVTEVKDNTFMGTFYGSPVENSLINKNWPKLYFAFSTRDQNHTYYHSGYLEDGTLYGMSYCPGREFTAPWTGTRK